jgi:predicted nucleic acid-binding protein
VLIEILDRQSIKGDQIYKKMISSGNNIATTSISLYETLYGLMKFQKPFCYLISLPIYDFSKNDAQQAAKFEIDLEKQGKKIKRTDIMIASTVINVGATLCSFDKEFKYLQNYGLKLFY